jgi:putative ABC transport system ATP-binding protein
MQIGLKEVMPLPLKDKLQRQSSDIWNSEIVFTQGDWVKIIAPSGTGKTTLIHILYRLRSDFSGSVAYDGTNINSIHDEDIAVIRQQKLSVIFQDLRLFSNLTARENIELKRVLQKPIYESNMIDAMAERLGITHILNQKAEICSYGEQQRIAIIRSLMQPFELLLMDEPFSHLDNVNTKKAAELIAEECKKRNAGFVLTDLDEDNNFNYSRKLSL